MTQAKNNVKYRRAPLADIHTRAKMGGTQMNNEDARKILSQLAEGVDPVTGEVFPTQHVCNEPVVIRALYKAINALEGSAYASPAKQQEERRERHSRTNRLNNSKPWTPEEDTYLRNAHRCGATYEQMSAQLLRSPRLIKFRAVYFDLATRDILSGYPPFTPGCEHQGLPWYPEEDKLLAQMFSEGYNLKDIASRLKRSVGGITSRLEKRGLIERRFDSRSYHE